MPNPYAPMQRPTTPGLPQDPNYTEWAKRGLSGPPSGSPGPGYQQAGASPVAGSPQNPPQSPFANFQNWWQQQPQGGLPPLAMSAAPLPPPAPIPMNPGHGELPGAVPPIPNGLMPANPYANIGAQGVGPHPGMMPINFYSHLMQPGY